MKINSTKLGMLAFLVLLTSSMVPLFGVSASSPHLNLKEEKVIIWAQNADFGNENSVFELSSVYAGYYLQSMYAGLLRRTIASDQQFVPDLAAADPVVSADGLNWTVQLRPGLKFADGTDLNASAVKFSYTLGLTASITDTASGNFPYLNNDSVVVDAAKPLEVKFNLLKPFAFAAGLLSFAIVSPDPVTGFGQQWDDCNSGILLACTINAIDGSDLKGESGPFQVESYSVPNNFASLVPNPFYYMADQIKLDRLVITTIGDSTAAQAALAGGEINLFDANYKAKVNELDDIPGLTEQIVGAAVWQEMYVNHLHPYFGAGNFTTATRTDYTALGNYTAARLIRYAMTHMVDRNFAANEIAQGLGSPASIPVPQIVAGFDDTLEPRAYDLTLARSYMAEAGFDFTGKTYDAATGAMNTPFFEITLLSPTGNPDREQWATRMAAELPKIGIGVKEHLQVGFADIYPRVFDQLVPPVLHDQGGYDVSFVGWFSPIDYTATGTYDKASWIPNGGSVINWENATMEAQANLFETELDVPTRIAAFKVWQAMLYYNEVSMPIIYTQDHWAWDESIVGMDASSLGSRNFEWETVDINLEGPVTVTDTLTNTATTTEETTKTTESPISVLTIFFGITFTAFIAIYRRKN